MLVGSQKVRWKLQPGRLIGSLALRPFGLEAGNRLADVVQAHAGGNDPAGAAFR